VTPVALLFEAGGVLAELSKRRGDRTRALSMAFTSWLNQSPAVEVFAATAGGVFPIFT